MTAASPTGPPLSEALRALGTDALVLAIHDLSFPADAGDDTGRGSPASPAGQRFLAWVRRHGFTGVQLGPSGRTAADNPSPYDGTLFARSPLTISLARLADPAEEAPWLAPEHLAAAVAARPSGGERRVPQRHVHRLHATLLDAAFETWRRHLARGDRRATGLETAIAAFTARHREWLERDGLWEAIRRERGGAFSGRPDEGLDGRLFDPGPGEASAARRRREVLRRRHAARLERHRFEQYLAHAHHDAMRREARRIGLHLQGDLQVGMSPADHWAWRPVFLRGWRMGAPPSRTNPAGQPWDYPVLDPEQLGRLDDPGPALAFHRARIDKTLHEFDGLRVDHPHGLVCPWVYRTGTADPFEAVRAGARLHASPDRPELARYARVGPADLNPDRAVPRHDDRWVVHLSEAQLDRYALLVDATVEALHQHGRRTADLVCEVLSTMPYPLGCVLSRHGLGRFRVTQKADPRNPDDPYRPDHARPEDWVMLGTHDTPPIWSAVEGWRKAGDLRDRAAWLAAQLAASPLERERLATWILGEPGALPHAELAACLASPARNVMLFVSDWLGEVEVYNRPGVVSDENWTLRVPRDYERVHRERASVGRALHLPWALALALRARGGESALDLARRLEAA